MITEYPYLMLMFCEIFTFSRRTKGQWWCQGCSWNQRLHFSFSVKLRALWWEVRGYDDICKMLCTSVETKPSMNDWSDNIAAKSLQSCPTLCDPIDGIPPGSCPWDSPGTNTGVGCHFLLQCMKVKVKSLSRVRLFATPWTVAYQAPLSMGFPRQEYWSGVPLPSPLITLIGANKVQIITNNLFN